MQRANVFFEALWAPVITLTLSGLLIAGDAHSVPFDTDTDGWTDAVEDQLGSDKNLATSTPESISIPESCVDGADNDGDLDTDAADSGCTPPPIFQDSFPAGAGLDVFESTMTLQGLSFGLCQLDFDGRGPTVISRGAPSAGTIQTEIVAMQLTGTGTPLTSFCGGLPVGIDFDLTIVEDPSSSSTGEVASTGVPDFPAESFFDVVAVADVPGNPTLTLTVRNTINSIPPYHSPGNPALNPNCYAVPGLPHLHCPKPPLDHFKCYKPKPEKLIVGLTDQFHDETVELKAGRKPDTFCNPVAKTLAGATTPIFDSGAHLSCYKIKDVTGTQFVQRDVFIQNQLSTDPVQITVLKPDTLCVPTQKDPDPPPAALDHFKCYKVRATPFKPSPTANLQDQFDAEVVDIIKPFTLCNPVQKTVSGETIEIGDSAAHLVCYKIKNQTTFSPVTVSIQNQFGTDSITAKKPFTLCVPSLKFDEAPPEVCEDTVPDTCGGTCPLSTQQCVVSSDGQRCECVEVSGLCQDGSPGQCTGTCPQDEECLDDPVAGCNCFPITTGPQPCTCGDPCDFTCPDQSTQVGQCVIQDAAGLCFCTALCPGLTPLCVQAGPPNQCGNEPCDVSCPDGSTQFGGGLCQFPDTQDGCLCGNLGIGQCP
jgi:hypothetical protein